MIFRFGSFELDDETLELRRHGRPTAVRRKVLETILFLVRNRDRVVTKEDLMGGPWQGSIVSDSALSQTIKDARRVLADRAANPTMIATVWGRGFRFKREVIVLPARDRSRVAVLRPANDDPVFATPAAAAPADRASEADRTPMPSRRPADRFVGRRDELAELHAALQEAREGRGSVVLVSGGPGIGKTALVERFALECGARGAEVLRGRCWEAGGAPAFWPWPEVLRAYVEKRAPATVAGLARQGLGDLARLLPTLPDLMASIPPAERVAADDETPQTRFRVLESVTRFLDRAAGEASSAEPLVIVIDDLHAADDSALLLLDFLRASIAETRLLVVGTCRSLEASERPLLQAATSGAFPRVRNLSLSGLTPEEVRVWLAHARGIDTPSHLAAAVHRATLGHPLLLLDLTRSLPRGWRPGEADLGRVEGHDVQLPERIAGGFRQRLERLPADTQDLLRVAAVAGREFSTPILRAHLQSRPGAGDPQVATTLAPALAAGLVERSPAPGADYHFAHDLVRETIYFGLSLPARLDLHAAVGQWLAERLPTDPGSIFGVAHHLILAASRHAPEVAVRRATEAGERAQRQAAYELAADYYWRALTVLDLHVGDSALRGDLLLRLGRAQHLAGRKEEAVTTYQNAAEWGKLGRFDDVYARGLLGWFEVLREYSMLNEPLHAAVQEALAWFREPSARRAQMMALDVAAGHFKSPLDDRRARLRQALEMARQAPDADAVVTVLDVMQLAGFHLTDADGSLALVEETLQATQPGRRPDRALDLHLLRASCLLELGRGQAFLEALAGYERRVEELRYPVHVWLAELGGFTRALLAGELSERGAEALARRALLIGEPHVGLMARGLFGAALICVGLERDGAPAAATLSEAMACGETLLRTVPTYLPWIVFNGVLAIERGDAAEARAVLAHFIDDPGLARLPDDWNRIVCLAMLSRMASALGDARSARALIAALGPEVGRHAAYLGWYLGPVSYYLGTLWRAAGEPARAHAAFERAIVDGQRIGSRPWVAWAQLGFAETLVGVGADPGSRRRSLLDIAGNTARRLGMARLQRLVDAAG